MYLQNEKMAKFLVSVDLSNKRSLSKYIKLLCKIKL